MKYTIVYVNDRAIGNIEKNKIILKSYKYINDIKFFNGNTGNASYIINNRKINLDTWNPYDGRSFPALPGELGIWESTIRIFEYIVNNDIDIFLVLEDDILLVDNAQEILKEVLSELPEDFDFLSLYSFSGQNSLDSKTDIGAKYIHKSINQPAGAQAMIYSKKGAKYLLKLIRRKGIEYTSDCFIFEQARLGILKGYSLIPETAKVLSHEYKSIKSLIDPDNTRKVDM